MADTHHGHRLDASDTFPIKQILSLAICRLAEPIAFTSVMSYTYVMVEDIKGKDNTSLFAGLIVSAFAVAEAATAIFWGALSDSLGRKPIILFGLAGTALSCLLLGFARNYWVAFIARLLGGLLNGNVAVIQTMVSEIVKNPKHEPIAYAMHPFTWTLGSILGSVLGGYAAQPAKFYPGTFSPNGIFGRFPYLLPNLICVAIMAIVVVQAAVLLQETRVVSSQPSTSYSTSEIEHVDERTPLQNRQLSTSFLETEVRSRSSFSLPTGSMPSPVEPSLDIMRSSFGIMIPIKLDPDYHSEGSAIDEDVDDAAPSPHNKLFNRTVAMWIVSIVLMSYHTLAFISVVPIYVLDPPRRINGLDLVGGLGLTVHDVGNIFTANSVWSMFVQIVIFPVVMAWFGVWKCVVWTTILCPIIDTIVPFVGLAPYSGAVLCIAFAVRTSCYIFIYPSQLIMLKNSVSNTDDLGKINGLTVSAASVGRTIAPPLVGIFYDTLGSAAAWWSCGVFAALGLIQLAFIPRTHEKEQKIIRRASVDSRPKNRPYGTS